MESLRHFLAQVSPSSPVVSRIHAFLPLKKKLDHFQSGEYNPSKLQASHQQWWLHALNVSEEKFVDVPQRHVSVTELFQL